MRFFLPPSETKTAPTRGKTLDLDSLRCSEALTEARRRALEEVSVASSSSKASTIFGVSEALMHTVSANTVWASAPSAPCLGVYDGVLYSALDFPSLDPQAKRRANQSLLVFSALFGILSPSDRIFAYRASGSTKIPGLGKALNAYWRPILTPTLEEIVGDELILDTRSGTYASMYRGAPESTASIDVFQERGGELKVVSHFAKHTRGQVIREILKHSLQKFKSFDDVAQALSQNWRVELQGPAKSSGSSLRIILPEDHQFTDQATESNSN